MRNMHIKNLITSIIIGTVGTITVFGASEIKSATLSNHIQNTEIKTKTQKINIDVKSIEPKGCIELGEYKLSAGDNIHFNVSATGSGFSIGFIKSTENSIIAKNTYFTQTIYGKNATIKNNNVPVSVDLAGSYKLYIKNVGENKIADIKGSVEVIKEAEGKIEKTDIKEQIAEIEYNTEISEYKTIDVDIANTSNTVTTSEKSPNGKKYYYAFGPYYYTGNTKKVLIDIKNGVDGNLFIATSPNKEMTDGVTNTYSQGLAYKGSIGTYVSSSGYYYVIIGADNFKNLKGTIQVPVSNLNNNKVIIPVNIKAIKSKENMYFGPYSIKKGDSIIWDLSAVGDGTLTTGFAKEKNNNISYWTQIDFNNENKIKNSWSPSEHQFSYVFEEGLYYLWVGNNGDKTLTNISGNVKITNYDAIEKY